MSFIRVWLPAIYLWMSCALAEKSSNQREKELANAMCAYRAAWSHWKVKKGVGENGTPATQVVKPVSLVSPRTIDCYTGTETQELRKKCSHGVHTSLQDPPDPCQQPPNPTSGPGRTEQEQPFWALLQPQAENWQLIRSRVQLASTPAATSTDATAKPHVLLHQMGSQDNLEVFVVLFEHVAKACSWPVSQWVVYLLPLLTQ